MIKTILFLILKICTSKKKKNLEQRNKWDKIIQSLRPKKNRKFKLKKKFKDPKFIDNSGWLGQRLGEQVCRGRLNLNSVSNFHVFSNV